METTFTFDTRESIAAEYKRRYREAQEEHGLFWLPWNLSFPISEWARQQHVRLTTTRHQLEAKERKQQEIQANPHELVCDRSRGGCGNVFVKRPTRGRPPKVCYECKPR